MLIDIFFKLIFFISIFSGGNNTNSVDDYKESSAQIHFVDMSKTEDSGPGILDQFLESWSIVQLETNKDCLIGEIEKIILQPDRIYIMDSNLAESVFVFDREGNWINTISRKGRGPNEYINFTDIGYDADTQKLYLLCGTKIMIFDRDGGYLSTLNVPFVPEKIAISENFIVISTIVQSRNFTSSVIICDKNMQVINQYFPRPKEWNSIADRAGSPLSTYKNKINYFPGQSTYVYNVTNDSVVAVQMYDFRQYNLPEELKGPVLTRERIAAKQGYINNLSYFQETNNYFIFSVIFKGRNVLIFHSKVNQQISSYYQFNHPFGLYGFGSIAGISEDYVITTVDADLALRSIKDENGWLRERSPEGWEYYKNLFRRPLNEEDNPILYFYKLK